MNRPRVRYWWSRAEHRAVDEVGRVSVEVADLGDHLGQVGGVHAHVLHADVAGHRLHLDLQPQRVAEGAVGVRERGEEVGVLAVRRRGDDVAVGEQHVHRAHRLVRQAVPERRGLDAQPGDRAAERDRLELRDDERHDAAGQRGCGERLVGGHALDLGGAGGEVDVDDAGERGGVEPLRLPFAEAEEVRRLLAQPHAGVGPERAELPDEIVDRRERAGPGTPAPG